MTPQGAFWPKSASQHVDEVFNYIFENFRGSWLRKTKDILFWTPCDVRARNHESKGFQSTLKIYFLFHLTIYMQSNLTMNIQHIHTLIPILHLPQVSGNARKLKRDIFKFQESAFKKINFVFMIKPLLDVAAMKNIKRNYSLLLFKLEKEKYLKDVHILQY